MTAPRAAATGVGATPVGPTPDRPPCTECDNTGWIPVDDPVVGANILTRCPQCEEA
jgi:hypothetical protein